MFQYRKVLAMKAEGFSIRSMSSATGHSRQKITTVLEVAKEKEVDLKTLEDVSDKWLEAFLYPEKSEEQSSDRAIDFEYIHKELAKKNVTLSLMNEDFVFIYIILSWCGSLLCIQWLSSPPWMALFSAQVALFEYRIHNSNRRC